jgi:hypothetical protein
MHNHALIATTMTQQTIPKPIPAQSGIPIHQDVHHNTPIQWDIRWTTIYRGASNTISVSPHPNQNPFTYIQNTKLFEGVEVTVGEADEREIEIEIEREPFVNGSGWK